MITWLNRLFQREPPTEREQDRNLAEAEAALHEITERGDRALKSINARHRRNHWQEAIDQMIHDAPRGKA